MHADTIVSARPWPVACFEDLVLKAARRRHNAGFLAVLSEERLALLEILLGGFREVRRLCFLCPHGEPLNDGVGLGGSECRRPVLERVGKAPHECGNGDFRLGASDRSSHVHADRVARAVRERRQIVSAGTTAGDERGEECGERCRVDALQG